MDKNKAIDYLMKKNSYFEDIYHNIYVSIYHKNHAHIEPIDHYPIFYIYDIFNLLIELYDNLYIHNHVLSKNNLNSLVSSHKFNIEYNFNINIFI